MIILVEPSMAPRGSQGPGFLIKCQIGPSISYRTSRSRGIIHIAVCISTVTIEVAELYVVIIPTPGPQFVMREIKFRSVV